jgi:ParB family transcriptional regulator, chromosome partitioning protein
MKAADRLSQALGAHISESMGAHTGAGGLAGSGPFPAAVVHGGPGAGKYRGAARIKDAFAVDLDRLAPDPDQPRKDFDPDELDRLAASLKARGQLQPARVRYDEEADRWVLIAGERRYRAARLAGLGTLICVEAKGRQSPDDRLEDQLVENCVREDLKPVEQARAFRALLDRRGCSYRQLADSLNISHQAIVRALALLDLPEDLQAKVDAGAVPASAASEAARITDASQRREILARVEAGTMTRDDVTRAVKSRAAKGRGARPTPPIDDRPRRAGNGVKVRVVATPKHTLADVAAALREVADRLDAGPSGDAA